MNIEAIAILIALAVAASTAACLYVLNRYNQQATMGYCLKSVATGAVLSTPLILLAHYNLLFYFCVAGLILMSVRSISEHLFHPTYGFSILGVILGLWFSLPPAGYQLAT